MMDKKSEQLSCALSRKVFAYYEKAKQAKCEVYDTLMDCYNMSQGKPLIPASDGVDVTMDIASPVVQNIIGLLRHILLNNEQAPFVVKPTPRAELSDQEMQEIIDQVTASSDMFIQQGFTQSQVEDVISEMKQTVLLRVNQKARKAAERQTELVQDQLHDAGWKEEFIGFLKHFCIYPAAIMKGPTTKRKHGTYWQNDRIVVKSADTLAVELISPFDFYPAPYSRDVQSADYIIERRRLTRGDLYNLIGAEDYDDDAIDHVLDNYPDGYVLNYEQGSGEPDHLDNDTVGDINTVRDVFDALGYYGTIRGDILVDAGLAVDDERVAYEVEVWVIGGVVIKAVLNPDPIGNRPFFVASFDATTDSIWGISPMMRLRDTQKTATAAVRALIRNMAFSSGPVGEVIAARIKDGLDPRQVLPNTIRLVEDASFSGVSPTAYTFYQVPSLSQELLATFERFINYSYELLGIPRVAFGQTEGMGSVGRTSGGISIVMNQATKAIKNAMTELEAGLIEPIVNRFILFNQLNNPDPALRGDVRAFAKGVSGLIEKENKAEDLQWALQSIAGMMNAGQNPDGSPIIPPQAPLRLLYEMFKLKGISPAGILPDFDAQDAMMEDMGQAAAAASGGTPMGGSPLGSLGGSPLGEGMSTATLDGRSPDAAMAIDAANNL